MNTFAANLDNLRKIERYAEQHSTQPGELQYRLERETWLTQLSPNMISGQLQGQFLSFVSQMIQPRYILELGTFTGYSALCMAEGLSPDGELHTIEVKAELLPTIHKYVSQHRHADKIKVYSGSALEIIPKLNKTFDLIFIDADKLNYIPYYEMCIEILRPGGWLIADNVLWYGKVTLENKDADSANLDNFNKHIRADDRVENLLLPLRDGLMICRKKNFAMS